MDTDARHITDNTSQDFNGSSLLEETTVAENSKFDTQVNAQTKYSDKRSFKGWVTKYFLEGQKLRRPRTEAAGLPWYLRLLKSRRVTGVLIPFVFVHVIWWSCAIKYDYWKLFPEKYFMSITMLFGSFIAGMTSEGGASVAFPIMTLAFGIKPSIARDFSFIIQSCGMTAAAFTIFWMRIIIEWYSIVFCSIGGAVGLIIGLEYIDPNLTPPQKKIGFVTVWFSFAFALFLLNRHYKRPTFYLIPQRKTWKAIVLVITGFWGGVFSSISGSGVDICSFSVLTLLFRVTEKTATPTSVVVMAINTVIGSYWRQVMMQAVHIDAYYYFAVCAPIVVLGAPVGSVVGSHFHRQVLACFVYITDTVALVTAYIIVPMSTYLIGISAGVVVIGFVFFYALSWVGQRIMVAVVREEIFCDNNICNNTSITCQTEV